MQRARVTAVVLVVLLIGGAAATAQPADLNGTAQWTPGIGGWASGPFAYVDSVPFEVGPAGGLARKGDLLLATSWTSFSLYDVSDPRAPKLLSLTPLGPHFINERPQIGDGWIALNSDYGRTLTIFDISDPTEPAQLAVLRNPGADHQWTCVLDCTYLYSNVGSIVSMADPAKPEVVGSWYDSVTGTPRATHGIAEVAPGIVLTGTLPVYLLDARENPAEPANVVTTEVRSTRAGRPYVILGPPPESFAADIAWPVDGAGDFAVMSMETPFSGECTGESGEVLSLDMRAAFDEQHPAITVADGFQITDNGLPSDGRAPANAVGCSPYVLAVHPDHAENGWVAVGFFEQGVRLLSLDEDGGFSEVGGFISHGGAAAAPIWIDDETLYVLDFVRGIDILSVSSS